MSVEIRFNADNNLECNWGVIEHGNPKPALGMVGHLILITPDYVRKLAAAPQNYRGHIATLTSHGQRTFVHLEYGDRTWTWELFPAYFADRKGPDMMIGRWPD
jgi:hypothetical protein